MTVTVFGGLILIRKDYFTILLFRFSLILVSIDICKHLEARQKKKNATRRIFNSLLGV